MWILWCCFMKLDIIYYFLHWKNLINILCDILIHLSNLKAHSWRNYQNVGHHNIGQLSIMDVWCLQNASIIGYRALRTLLAYINISSLQSVDNAGSHHNVWFWIIAWDLHMIESDWQMYGFLLIYPVLD